MYSKCAYKDILYSKFVSHRYANHILHKSTLGYSCFYYNKNVVTGYWHDIMVF